MSFLKTLGGLVADVSPFGLANAAVNKVSGGNIGFDPTPGFGATKTLNNVGTGVITAGINPSSHGVIYSHGSTNATANPVANAGQPGGTLAAGSGGSTVDPQAQALFNQNSGILNAALGRLPNQLAIAQSNTQGQFNQNNNELDSGKANTDQQYGQSTNQNQQQFVTNKNQINDQASSGLRSLLRVLGQHGAGGSSAALYAAPDAVGQVASQQRSGAGQTFGQNQQALDTNYNQYVSGYDNSKKQLSDWLSQQQNSNQAKADSAKADLLHTLAGLQPNVAAAQPFVDQINSLSSEVDNLGKLNPTYTGTTPVYNAPDVASYTVNQTGAPVLGGGGNGTGAGSTPFLNFLLGQQKDRNQLQPQF